MNSSSNVFPLTKANTNTLRQEEKYAEKSSKSYSKPPNNNNNPKSPLAPATANPVHQSKNNPVNLALTVQSQTKKRKVAKITTFAFDVNHLAIELEIIILTRHVFSITLSGIRTHYPPMPKLSIILV